MHSMLPAEAIGNIAGSFAGIAGAVKVTRVLSDMGVDPVVSAIGGTIVGGTCHLVVDYLSTGIISILGGDPITAVLNNATSPLETLITSPWLFLASVIAAADNA